MLYVPVRLTGNAVERSLQHLLSIIGDGNNTYLHILINPNVNLNPNSQTTRRPQCTVWPLAVLSNVLPHVADRLVGELRGQPH